MDICRFRINRFHAQIMLLLQSLHGYSKITSTPSRCRSVTDQRFSATPKYEYIHVSSPCTICEISRDDLFSGDYGFKINTLVTKSCSHIYSPKTTNHTFQKYCIFRGNFTFSLMETMETRGEPSDN
jgi:hypothetical protein